MTPTDDLLRLGARAAGAAIPTPGTSSIANALGQRTRRLAPPAPTPAPVQQQGVAAGATAFQQARPALASAFRQFAQGIPQTDEPWVSVVNEDDPTDILYMPQSVAENAPENYFVSRVLDPNETQARRRPENPENLYVQPAEIQAAFGVGDAMPSMGAIDPKDVRPTDTSIIQGPRPLRSDPGIDYLMQGLLPTGEDRPPVVPGIASAIIGPTTAPPPPEHVDPTSGMTPIGARPVEPGDGRIHLAGNAPTGLLPGLRHQAEQEPPPEPVDPGIDYLMQGFLPTGEEQPPRPMRVDNGEPILATDLPTPIRGKYADAIGVYNAAIQKPEEEWTAQEQAVIYNLPGAINAELEDGGLLSEAPVSPIIDGWDTIRDATLGTVDSDLKDLITGNAPGGRIGALEDLLFGEFREGGEFEGVGASAPWWWEQITGGSEAFNDWWAENILTPGAWVDHGETAFNTGRDIISDIVNADPGEWWETEGRQAIDDIADIFSFDRDEVFDIWVPGDTSATLANLLRNVGGEGITALGSTVDAVTPESAEDMWNGLVRWINIPADAFIETRVEAIRKHLAGEELNPLEQEWVDLSQWWADLSDNTLEPIPGIGWVVEKGENISPLDFGEWMLENPERAETAYQEGGSLAVWEAYQDDTTGEGLGGLALGLTREATNDPLTYLPIGQGVGRAVARTGQALRLAPEASATRVGAGRALEGVGTATERILRASEIVAGLGLDPALEGLFRGIQRIPHSPLGRHAEAEQAAQADELTRGLDSTMEHDPQRNNRIGPDEGAPITPPGGPAVRAGTGDAADQVAPDGSPVGPDEGGPSTQTIGDPVPARTGEDTPPQTTPDGQPVGPVADQPDGAPPQAEAAARIDTAQNQPEPSISGPDGIAPGEGTGYTESITIRRDGEADASWRVEYQTPEGEVVRLDWTDWESALAEAEQVRAATGEGPNAIILTPARWTPDIVNGQRVIDALLRDIPDPTVRTQVLRDMSDAWQESVERQAAIKSGGTPTVDHAIETSRITNATYERGRAALPEDWQPDFEASRTPQSQGTPYHAAEQVIHQPWSETAPQRRYLYRNPNHAWAQVRTDAQGDPVSVSPREKTLDILPRNVASKPQRERNQIFDQARRYVDLVNEHERWMPNDPSPEWADAKRKRQAIIDNLQFQRYQRERNHLISEGGLPGNKSTARMRQQAEAGQQRATQRQRDTEIDPRYPSEVLEDGVIVYQVSDNAFAYVDPVRRSSLMPKDRAPFREHPDFQAPRWFRGHVESGEGTNLTESRLHPNQAELLDELTAEAGITPQASDVTPQADAARTVDEPIEASDPARSQEASGDAIEPERVAPDPEVEPTPPASALPTETETVLGRDLRVGDRVLINGVEWEVDANRNLARSSGTGYEAVSRRLKEQYERIVEPTTPDPGPAARTVDTEADPPEPVSAETAADAPVAEAEPPTVRAEDDPLAPGTEGEARIATGDGVPEPTVEPDSAIHELGRHIDAGTITEDGARYLHGRLSERIEAPEIRQRISDMVLTPLRREDLDAPTIDRFDVDDPELVQLVLDAEQIIETERALATVRQNPFADNVAERLDRDLAARQQAFDRQLRMYRRQIDALPPHKQPTNTPEPNDGPPPVNEAVEAPPTEAEVASARETVPPQVKQMPRLLTGMAEADAPYMNPSTFRRAAHGDPEYTTVPGNRRQVRGVKVRKIQRATDFSGTTNTGVLFDRPLGPELEDLFTRFTFGDGSNLIERLESLKWQYMHGKSKMWPDDAEAAAVRQAKQDIEARLKELYPAVELPIPLKRFLQGWDGLTQHFRETILFGWDKVFRYPMIQAFGNAAIATYMGRPHWLPSYVRNMPGARREILANWGKGYVETTGPRQHIAHWTEGRALNGRLLKEEKTRTFANRAAAQRFVDSNQLERRVPDFQARLDKVESAIKALDDDNLGPIGKWRRQRWYEHRRQLLAWRDATGDPDLWKHDPGLSEYGKFHARLKTRQGRETRQLYNGMHGKLDDPFAAEKFFRMLGRKTLGKIAGHVIGTKKSLRWGTYWDGAWRETIGVNTGRQQFREVIPDFRNYVTERMVEWGYSERQAIEVWDRFWATSRDGLFNADELRDFYRQYVTEVRANRLHRDWQSRVYQVEKEIDSEIRRLSFAGDETRADLFLKRTLIFHYFFSRQTWQFARQAARHPFMIALADDIVDELAEYQQEHGGIIPDWSKGWLALLGLPYGRTLLGNPLYLFSTWLMFRSDTAFQPANMTAPGAVLTKVDDLLGLNPVIDTMANLLGMEGDTWAPDILGLASHFRTLTTIVNAGRARGWWGNTPNPLGNVYEDTSEQFRDFLSGLGFPGTEHIEATSSQAAMEREIAAIAIDEAQKQGMDPANNAEDYDWVMEQLEDSESDLYLKAVKRWTGGEVVEVITRMLLGPIGPRTRIAETSAEGEDIGLGESEIHPDLMQSIAGSPYGWDIINRTDPQARELMRQATAYQGLGTDDQRHADEVYTLIAYGTITVPVTINETTYQWDDIAKMDQDQRTKMAVAYLQERGVYEDWQTYKDEQDRFLAEEGNREFATYDTWRGSVWDYEGGPMAYWEELITEPENQDARVFYESVLDNNYTPARTEAILASPNAYMAAKGIQYHAYAPIPEGGGQDILGIFSGPERPQAYEPYEFAGHTELREDVPKVAQGLADWDRAVRAKQAELGIDPNIPFRELDYDTRIMIEDAVEVDGVKEPYIPDSVKRFLVWQIEQPEGADTSVEAYIRVLEQEYDAGAVERFEESIDPTRLSDEEAVSRLYDLWQMHDHEQYGDSGSGGGQGSGSSETMSAFGSFAWLVPSLP